MRNRAVGLATITLLIGLMAPPARAVTSDRVVVIVMENKTYAKISGNVNEAPFINSLAVTWRLFTDYHAVMNGSLHNYLAMIGGITTKPTQGSRNVFADLDASSLRWTSLQESMGGDCGVLTNATVPGSSEKLYKRGHDPAWQFRASDSCQQNDVPMTEASFDPATLPNFTIIVPNQCDDMHTFPTGGDCPSYFGQAHGNSAIAVGDNWLSVVVPQLLAQPDITVILTWDEGARASGQHIMTVEAGAGVVPSSTDSGAYDHFGLEAGLYQAFGLGVPPGGGSSATVYPIP